MDKLSPRLQHFRTRLMCYYFDVVYVAGNILVTADTQSRSPQPISSYTNCDLENLVQCHIDAMVQDLPSSDEKIELIRKATDEEEVCNQTVEFCLKSLPKHVDFNLIGYFRERDNIAFKNGSLLTGSWLIIYRLDCKNIFLSKFILVIRGLRNAENVFNAVVGGLGLAKIFFTLKTVLFEHKIDCLIHNLRYLV